MGVGSLAAPTGQERLVMARAQAPSGAGSWHLTVHGHPLEEALLLPLFKR